MRKLLILLLIINLTAALNLNAQILNPIHWKFNVNKISQEEFELIFTAKIENGWHLYSQKLPSGGPIPTKFSFVFPNGIAFTGRVESKSQPKTELDPNFKIELSYYTDEVIFIQKIKKKKAGKAKVTGQVEYMTCDNHRCLPPTEQEFEFAVE